VQPESKEAPNERAVWVLRTSVAMQLVLLISLVCSGIVNQRLLDQNRTLLKLLLKCEGQGSDATRSGGPNARARLPRVRGEAHPHPRRVAQVSSARRPRMLRRAVDVSNSRAD